MMADDDANVASLFSLSSTRTEWWISEKEVDERVVVSTVVAQQRFAKSQHSTIICDVTPQLRVDNNTTIAVEDNEITVFSVCAGIGSGQIAIERAGLPVRTIGVCDTDLDCASNCSRRRFQECLCMGI